LIVPLKLFGSAAHGVLEVVVEPDPAHASSTAPTAVIESPAANKRNTKSLREIFPIVNDRTRALTGSLAISILLIVDMRRTDETTDKWIFLSGCLQSQTLRCEQMD
jgi:hypothetical protein